MTRVLVAAGGGGDALAAAILHHSTPRADPAVIATYAWDHLVTDPVPGPRRLGDFTGLAPMAGRDRLFTPATRPIPPAGSMLPRLSAEISDRLVLLDPDEAASGLRTQLDELVTAHDADSVDIIDVGGDALAQGVEPGLRSPLADAMVVAACADLDVPSSIVVAGPGLDGELSEAAVIDAAGEGPDRVLEAADVAPFAHVLDWHPTESTALLAAAAHGLRGWVEIRDGRLSVELTDRSAHVYRLALGGVLRRSRVAAALVGSTSLDEAEEITRAVCGFSEIDAERRKAAALAPARDAAAAAAAAGANEPDDDELDREVRALEAAAGERGIDYLTFRRIAEALQLATEAAERLRRRLVSTRPEHDAWPLWAVHPA
jgi:hypothetical protein